MFEPRFSFLNSTRYTHGRRSLRGALRDVSEYGVSPSGFAYVYDPSGRFERDVYDAYGTGERPYGSVVPRPAGLACRLDMEKFDYQFQGHRDEAEVHRDDGETIAPAPSSSESSAPSAPSFVNFQLRFFNPKSEPWMSQEPADYVDGMNAYVFSRGDLVNPIKPL